MTYGPQSLTGTSPEPYLWLIDKSIPPERFGHNKLDRVIVDTDRGERLLIQDDELGVVGANLWQFAELGERIDWVTAYGTRIKGTVAYVDDGLNEWMSSLSIGVVTGLLTFVVGIVFDAGALPPVRAKWISRFSLGVGIGVAALVFYARLRNKGEDRAPPFGIDYKRFVNPKTRDDAVASVLNQLRRDDSAGELLSAPMYGNYLNLLSPERRQAQIALAIDTLNARAEKPLSLKAQFEGMLVASGE